MQKKEKLFLKSRGTGIYHTLFHDYEPVKGEIETQELGSLVSMESGPVSAYALHQLQQRGTFFVLPAEEVYSGQVVGQHIRNEELVINVCKTKVLSAVRTGPTAIVRPIYNSAIPALILNWGFLLATAFISMWVSNAATAMLMMPIGLSVAAMMKEEGGSRKNFSLSLMLGIGYASTIGGMGTPIGRL